MFPYNGNGNVTHHERGRRSNSKQKLILFTAMANNRDILEIRKGADLDMRRKKKAHWKKLVEELNMAGPQKDVVQWRKCWTDLRLGMRKKWEKAQNSSYVLTEYERRVINACGMIDNYVDVDFEEENAETFLCFLQEDRFREEESFGEQSAYVSDESYAPNSHYYTDSCEPIICEPEEQNIKQEYEEEDVTFQEPPVEYISDDDDKESMTFEYTTKQENHDNCLPYEPLKTEPPFQEKELECQVTQSKENYIECISDDEEPTIVENSIKIKEEDPMECSTSKPLKTEQISHEDEKFQSQETKIQETKSQKTTSQKTQSSEQPPILLPPINNISLPPSQKLQDATLKEIRKMHRNLLKESKKQTSLLRKLVRGLRQ